MYCASCGSNKVEANNLCASCAHEIRKAARVKVKVVKPVKRISDKEAKRLAKYHKLREGYLNAHLLCQAKIKDVCTLIATEIHHTAKRVGDNLTDVESFLAVCPHCHRHIESVMSANERRGKGFLK